MVTDFVNGEALSSNLYRVGCLLGPALDNTNTPRSMRPSYETMFLLILCELHPQRTRKVMLHASEYEN